MIIGIGNIPTVTVGKTGIKIKKSHQGLFTEYCGGEVTDKCIQKAKKSKNPTLRKRATFAQNARAWKHQEGGLLEAGMSFIPIVGTYQSYQDFKKDPSLANLGWTLASGFGDVLQLTGLGYGIGSAIKGLKAANNVRKSVQAVNNVRRATRLTNQAKMLEYGEPGKRAFQGWKAAGVNLRNSDKKLEAATQALKDEALRHTKNAAKGFAVAATDPVDWAETIYKSYDEL